MYKEWNGDKVDFQEVTPSSYTQCDGFLRAFNDLLLEYNVDRIDVNVNSEDYPDDLRVIFYSNNQPLTLLAKSVAKLNDHKGCFSNYFRLYKKENGFVREREIVTVVHTHELIKIEGDGTIYKHAVEDDDVTTFQEE